MGEIRTLTRPILIRDIDAIILDPDGDAPAIGYWLSNGDRLLDVHHDERECQEIWNIMEEGLSNQDFLKYNNMFLHVNTISRFERRSTPALGHHLIFWFKNGRSLIQQYDDEQEIVDDARSISEILATLQDIRASAARPTTRQ